MTYAKYFLLTVSFFCLSANAGNLTMQDLEAKCAGKTGVFATVGALLGLSSQKDPYCPRVRPDYLNVS